MENPDDLKRLSVKLVVEKNKNRVVFSEAGKDFVDVLLSFLAMPFSTIINLREGVEVEVGCLTNLYRSVQALGDQHLKTLKCKDILLHPRSALELYCMDLHINLTTQCEESYYYACKSGNCDLVSCYLTHSCGCGKPLEVIVKPAGCSLPHEEKGFLRPTAMLMITDDFEIVPMSTRTALTLLHKGKALDGSKIGERCMKIGRDEIVNLLIASFTSTTPFSNSLMDTTPDSGIVFRVKYGSRNSDELQQVDTSNREKISLKLITYKSKALYAEVKEDFADLVFSFLTIPLGYVFKEFPYLSFEGCLGNLYKSTKDLDANDFFLSDEKKEMIINPKMAPGLRHSKHLFGIEEATNSSYSTLHSLFAAKNYYLKPDEEERVSPSEGFIKGHSMFMVTDDLTVNPLSVSSALSLINSLNIPLTDIQEHEVTMGEDEALRLLAASLVSKNALTDSFILKEPKQEK